MSPTLYDGQFIIIANWRGMNINKEDIVVAMHPKFGRIVKRVAMVTNSQDSVLLNGDNLLSTSTKKLGWLDRKSIVGKLVWTV